MLVTHGVKHIKFWVRIYDTVSTDCIALMLSTLCSDQQQHNLSGYVYYDCLVSYVLIAAYVLISGRSIVCTGPCLE
jgi:hypothetical protein